VVGRCFEILLIGRLGDGGNNGAVRLKGRLELGSCGRMRWIGSSSWHFGMCY
jgi:hypothetical protein